MEGHMTSEKIENNMRDENGAPLQQLMHTQNTDSNK